MAKIFTARYLVPIDAPPIVGGALLAQAGKIIAVGQANEIKRANPGVEIVDFEEAIITPLLVNAHTHLELTDFPHWAQKAGETADPDSFVDWILRLIRVKRGLTKKQYSQSVANGIQQSLAAGTGVVGDILSQYASRKAYRNAKLHGVLFLESLGHDPTIINSVKQELRNILAEENVGYVRLGLSPHSPYTISAEYLADIFSKCSRQQLPCSTHLSESTEEVAFIERSKGAIAERFYPFVGWEYLLPKAKRIRPAAYLKKQGGLFTENLLVHGVQLDQSEIDLLAAKRMTLALCPRSNARLKVGKAPIGKLLSAGVRLCLGTDSLASNDSLSIWDEIAFARSWFAGEVDAPTLLSMATIGGSQALGLSDQFGSLSVGKSAGFQVLKPCEMPSENNLYDFLTATGRSKEIDQIVLQGRIQGD